MKRYGLLALAFCSFLFIAMTATASNSYAKFSYQKNDTKNLLKTASIRFPFIENKGQLQDEKIRYYAKTLNGDVYITKSGDILYSIRQPDNQANRWMIKEHFIDASDFVLNGEDISATKLSFISMSKKECCEKDIPVFNTINFGQPYNGIEVKIKARSDTVEKLYYIKPNADPKQILITFSGIESLVVNSKGELEVNTKQGIQKFSRPIAYQVIDGDRQEVEVSYSIKDNKYGFKLGAYNTNHELIIDPLLASTFLGGSYNDYSTCLSFDSNGNVYVAGVTESIDFPATIGAYNPTFSTGSFVAKFDGNLQNLLAATFLTEHDMVHAISIDDSGNVVIAGASGSDGGDLRDYRIWDFGFFTGTHFGGCVSSAFVAILDSELQNLVASRTLNAMVEKAMATSLALDSSGNIFVLGMTSSSNFPVTGNAYDNTYSGFRWDIFVSKFDSNLATLLSSTFLGGNGDDYSLSLQFDDSDNVFITGATNSTDFPTTAGAFDVSYNNDIDGFVSKLDNNLETLLASTYIGGNYDDFSHGLSIDNSGNVYLTGMTRSLDFPTSSSAFDTSFNGNGDVFVSKFNNQLDTLVASTFIGGNGGDPGNGWFPDVGYSIFADSSGNVYVAGCTASVNGVTKKFPTTIDSYCPNPVGYHTNGFALNFDSDLQYLLVSTFLAGDPGHEYIYVIKPHSNGSIYLTGKTDSSDFPTTSGSYDNTYNLGQEAFISKFDSNFSSGTTTAINASGTWRFQDTSVWDSCDPNPQLEVNTCTVTQNGTNVTFEVDGNTFTGTVNSPTITVSGTYTENGGNVTQDITVTLSSTTSGIGTSTWDWSDGVNNCSGGSDFTFRRVSGSGSGDGGGGGGGGCFIKLLINAGDE